MITKIRISKILLVLAILSMVSGGAAQERSKDNELFKGLKYRHIGPYRGGRVTAVAGVTTQPFVYYMGATGGGMWKTTDGGVNWYAISDGQFGTGSVGGIGICEADPNIIYVGMGESPIRGNVSYGDGIYKSTDAGSNWKRVGLEDTHQIGRVRVHPRNPDIVYVAALGHVFGPHEQRGVFRTTDGGKSWQRMLYRNNKAGAIDLILDPTNPSIIYAGFWEAYRTPYSLESGGPGSGLFKSTDAGETWSELTRNPGLPKGMIGKVGITVSPVNSQRLWAIIEAEDGGVFRSDDAGKTWTKINQERKLRQRAWYYTRIYADPQNPESVYVLNVEFHRSNDGGRTFTNIPVPHGDNHDLWIAPNDPQRMIESNDGGAQVSVNGGKTWTEQDQPTAQIYRVAVDNDFPYNIYGAQQDNSTLKIPSRTTSFGITRNHWYPVGGGESGWIAPHPKDSNIIFAGSYGGYLTRYDHRTGQTREVTVWPENPIGQAAADQKYRFQWNAPLVFSPNDANTLYAAGNILFKSTDEGQSWQPISTDLTRNDKSKQGASGGPITKDNTTVEYYCTIFTVMESSLQPGLIWTGSDDGLVHITRDGGKSWTNVTGKDIPEWIQINSIEASSHDAGTAYIAATMYKSDDFKPYLYKTTDYGKSWQKIVNGIPNGAFTRVIREDPHRRGLLYAGTETGMYISFDDGKQWQPLQLNLPVVPITDLAVHKREKDLVVATQGRSFWLLDDLDVIHQVAEGTVKSDVYLLKPATAYRMSGGGGGELPATATIGENPPNGTIIYFYLKNKPTGEVKLEILDTTGQVLNTYTSKPPEGQTKSEEPSPRREEQNFVPAEVGLNRFVWNLRYPDATRVPGMVLWAAETRGPRALPGNYQARLTVDGKTFTQPFEVVLDPRLKLSLEDLTKQFELLIKTRNKLSETHNAITLIRDLRKQVEETVSRVKDQTNGKAVAEAGKALTAKLTAIEEKLCQPKVQSSQDVLNYPMQLNNKLAALASTVSSAEGAPTQQTYKVYEELTSKIDTELRTLEQLQRTDLVAFNQLVRDQNFPAVIIKEKSTK
ncbi:MAG: glycosyl hydrolase [Acidobacteriota bacterium]